MMRVVLLLAAAALAGGCVSGDDPQNGAIRILHAVSDGPRITFTFNNKVGVLDYRVSSAYLAVAAGQYPVKIEEQLPPGEDSDTWPVDEFEQILGVNDEVTLVVVGGAEAHTEKVLHIETTTRGVPTGKTRMQVVHAGHGGQPVDVYLLAPDALVGASTPFTSNLAYEAWTAQSEITGGNARVVVTAAGDPATILLESATVFLAPEGTMLIAVVNNTGLDSVERPFMLVMLTGSGSVVVPDKDSPAFLRIVNASPGSYTLDTFVNDISLNDTERQACGPATPDAGTFVVHCPIAYETVGPFDALDLTYVDPDTEKLRARSYEIKVQRSNADETDPSLPTAKTFPANLAATATVTALITGLIADTATTTEVTLQSVLAARRIATAAQLRIVNASVAGDQSVADSAEADRLDLTITTVGEDDCVPQDPLARPADVLSGFRKGADTANYQFDPSFLGGKALNITLTRVDSASPPAAPVVLLNKRIAPVKNSIYTLVITDSVPGEQPLTMLSLDNDPALADCPAPP